MLNKINLFVLFCFNQFSFIFFLIILTIKKKKTIIKEKFILFLTIKTVLCFVLFYYALFCLISKIDKVNRFKFNNKNKKIINFKYLKKKTFY